jgi:hypothetical protein
MKNAVFFLILLCGCSSFNREWHRAAIRPATANSIEGPWQGTWRSDINQHHGKLLCLMVHDTNSLYQAHFRATYAHIFHFSYTVPLEVQPHFGGWEFNGEANLGKLAGGSYYYEGRATTTNLLSTYKSTYDNGIFRLARPGKR